MRGKVITVSIVLAAPIALGCAFGWILYSPFLPGELSIVNDMQGVIDVPEDVREDASNLALGFYGNNPVACQGFVDNFLEVYSAAEDRDFLLIFNSGGLGRKTIGPEWETVLEGIEGELESLGYTMLLVVYVRTFDGLLESVKEISEQSLFYPSKPEPFAAQVDFLTEHIDSIRVILIGESSGAVLANEVMELLEANHQVYSIQTGIPFGYDGAASNRSLEINDNGITPDTVSTGDYLAIFRANIGRLPTYRPEEGHLFFYIRAPGHIYTWDHPGVRTQITSFLGDNFRSN
jgi:hypothetical protein